MGQLKRISMDTYLSNGNGSTICAPVLPLPENRHAVVRELFYEACSALYSDILDAIDHRLDVNEAELMSRRSEIFEQGAQLAEIAPNLGGIVASKLSTVNRAMMDLNLSRQEAISNDEQKPTALKQLRTWICSTSDKVMQLEAGLRERSLSGKCLDRLASDQQVLQFEIRTEGQILIENARRACDRYIESAEFVSERRFEREKKHLEALKKRWLRILLRSHYAQCEIELRQNDERNQNDKDVTRSGPEPGEPQVKRRRLSDYWGTAVHCEDRLTYEEDTIPFAEEEYERIEPPTKRMPNSLESDAEQQPDVGYSSGEHTNSETNDTRDTKMPSETEASDHERRLRIETSPVEIFYKTVCLDETGATDTEMPRVSMSAGWPISKYSTEKNVLTDSMIVNPEDDPPELDIDKEIEEVLALTNEDQNGNVQGLILEPTRWRELKSRRSSGHPPLPRNIFANIIEDDKNSCDASSEESDDLPSDISSVTPLMTTSMESRQSLKRRYKSRPNATSFSFSRFLTSPSRMQLGTSMCSNSSRAWSEVSCSSSLGGCPQTYALPPHPSGRSFPSGRRKLRARRLPRSMSDGEHLGLWLNTSTYSAPGATNPPYSAVCRDSDATAPEQSDGQVYEWDDYHPPAKVEGDWDDGEPDNMSVLTIEDDFEMQLGQTIDSALSRSRTPFGPNELNKKQSSPKTKRPIASVTGNPGKMEIADENWNFEESKTAPSAVTVGSSPKLDEEKQRRTPSSPSSRSDVLIVQATETPSSSSSSDPGGRDSWPPDSPVPQIIDQLRKFSDVMEQLNDDFSSSESTASALSSIKSIDQIASSFKVWNELHKRLISVQEELNSFLKSDCFAGDHSVYIKEFEPLCKGFEEGVQKVESMMSQLEVIREKWDDWAAMQQDMKDIMLSIEQELIDLRKGSDNSERIGSELKDCQERMNRLETVCNLLTTDLAKLNANPSSTSAFNFASELAVYSNALTQLKMRFEQEMRQCCSIGAFDKSTMVKTRKRKILKNVGEQISMEPSTVQKRGWTLPTLLLLAALSVLAAWLASSDMAWRMTFGPRLHYVNGPPPV